MTASARLATVRLVTSDDRVAISTGIAAGVGMLLLTVINIGRSFGYDEGVTYASFINGGSLRRALFTQVVFNNHPTFSATQAIAWRLGFAGETAQRLGPALAASLTVGLVVWYSTRRLGAVAGLSAGIVLALNPMFLGQARQLRGYALSALAVVVAGLLLERSWSDPRRRWLVAQTAAMVIAVTTHAYAVLPILMLAVATLALGRLRGEHVAAWTIGAIAAIALQSPLVDDAVAASRGGGTVFYDDAPVLLARSFLGWEWPAVILGGAAVLAGAIAIARRSNRHLAAVAGGYAVLAAVVALLWLVLQPRDFYGRFFITVLPLLAYLTARGVALLPRWWQEAAVVALAVALVPGAAAILDEQPTIRDGGEVANRALAAGLEPCGRNAEPLLVYAPPIRLISGQGDYETCDVFINVLGAGGELRAAADARFGSSRSLGGSITVWADEAVIDELTAGLGQR